MVKRDWIPIQKNEPKFGSFLACLYPLNWIISGTPTPIKSLDPRVKPKMTDMEDFGRRFQSPSTPRQLSRMSVSVPHAVILDVSLSEPNFHMWNAN